MTIRYRVRPSRPEEMRFVASSWTTSFGESPMARKVDREVYQTEKFAECELLLKSATPFVAECTDGGAKGLLLGHAVAARVMPYGPVLPMMYISWATSLCPPRCAPWVGTSAHQWSIRTTELRGGKSLPRGAGRTTRSLSESPSHEANKGPPQPARGHRRHTDEHAHRLRPSVPRTRRRGLRTPALAPGAVVACRACRCRWATCGSWSAEGAR